MPLVLYHKGNNISENKYSTKLQKYNSDEYKRSDNKGDFWNDRYLAYNLEYINLFTIIKQHCSNRIY